MFSSRILRSLILVGSLLMSGACSSGEDDSPGDLGGAGGGGSGGGFGGAGPGGAGGAGGVAGTGGTGGVANRVVTDPVTIEGTTVTLTATIPANALGAGFVWSTTAQPTWSDHLVGGFRSSDTTVTAKLTNLMPCTTYHVRAFIDTGSPNDVGYVYGTEVTFTIPGPDCPSTTPGDGPYAGPLTVTTVSVAVLVANADVTVKLTGSANAKEAGIVWGKMTRPTVDVVAGGGKTVKTGELLAGFNISTAKLEPCGKYYVRGYAVPTSGSVVYGNELMFMMPGLIDDCHPFNGYWQSTDGSVVLKGSATGLTFDSIAPGSNTGWYDALQKGFISLGSAFIKDVQPSGSSAWTASVLWKATSSSKGVYDVRFSPGSTITLSSDLNTMYIDSDNPFGGFGGTATLKRKVN